jgi:hypothetical protein
MKKQTLKIFMRLATLCILLTCFSIPARAGYFDEVYACDDIYYDTLYDCRSNILYPYDPTESQCRYNSGDSFVTCLNAIFTPMPQMDLCGAARAARDNCNAQYLPSQGLEYWAAYSACIEASGINQCE